MHPSGTLQYIHMCILCSVLSTCWATVGGRAGTHLIPSPFPSTAQPSSQAERESSPKELDASSTSIYQLAPIPGADMYLLLNGTRPCSSGARPTRSCKSTVCIGPIIYFAQPPAPKVLSKKVQMLSIRIPSPGTHSHFANVKHGPRMAWPTSNLVPVLYHEPSTAQHARHNVLCWTSRLVQSCSPVWSTEYETCCYLRSTAKWEPCCRPIRCDNEHNGPSPRQCPATKPSVSTTRRR